MTIYTERFNRQFPFGLRYRSPHEPFDTSGRTVENKSQQINQTVRKSVRIGGASGFWGDSSVGAPQLVALGNVDYLVFDYLAELTMSILAAARAKNPQLGYATDFVTVTMKTILQDVAAKGIKVISNAGGMNPRACAQAIQALADEQGVTIKIAVVHGDDVLHLAPQQLGSDHNDRNAENATPSGKLLTANAYLGAAPIAQALASGAQIVITGRCVDSAVTLGALVHEFGWAWDDYDRLAQGSLAGHIIECGCQATGGLHTDWQAVPGWPHIGYPVIECHADGSFVVTKPPGTGGLVNCAVVAEQMLYEIGDPANYLLPDVVCDFTQVQLRQLGEHVVQVSQGRGQASSNNYKVSATYLDGFRCMAQLTIVGTDAAAKARRTAEAIVVRTRELFAAHGLADYSRTHIEVLGSEAGNFGPHAHTPHVREVVLQMAVMHPQKAALELFAREIAPAGTSWSPGTTGAAGRPHVSPCIKQWSFLLDKDRVTPVIEINGESQPFGALKKLGSDHNFAPTPSHTHPASANLCSDPNLRPPTQEKATEQVPLIRLAYARSGDKGNTSNIGVIARSPEFLPTLREELTEQKVGTFLAHLVQGKVTRYDVPGIHAMNFVCEQALDGGGMASLRNDALGKGMAQILLTMLVSINPETLLNR
jgi:hypothetical protein